MTVLTIAIIILAASIGLSLIQKAVYKRLWNKNLSYNLTASKKAAFEGEKVEITDSVTNGKSLPLPWVYANYLISQYLIFLDSKNNEIRRGERRTLLFVVGTNKTASRKSKVLCSKRGYYVAREFSISANNPLMTEHTRENSSLNFSLLVYPRIVDYPEAVIPLKRIFGTATVKRFIDPDPFVFKGIREYLPTDSFRQINWSATAKSGTLMSNIHDFTVEQNITILLNLERYNGYNRGFVFEEAIRLAAFLSRQCIEVGVPVSLVCPAGDGRPVQISSGLSAAHLETIYATLAYINLNADNHSVAEYLPGVSDKAFILISSYHEADLYEKFMFARRAKTDISWILPHSERDEISAPPHDDITKMEVHSDALV